MLKNFLRVALRRWVKNKTYTFINVFGLCLGVVSALAIFQIVRFETSFDTYHTDADRIYRVVQERNEFGSIKYLHGIAYPLPEALRNDFAEIEAITIVDREPDPYVISLTGDRGEQLRFSEESVAYVNPDYFKIFAYQWSQGDAETALQAPNSIVISQNLATKYFGRQDVLGEVLILNNRTSVKIAGVVSDVPTNTDLPFDMLIAFDKERLDPNWGNNYGFLNCYLKLAPGIEATQLEGQFDGFLTKYRGEKEAEEFTYILQPLSDLHFNTRFANFNRTIARGVLAGLSLIAAGLILMACINFMNLSTAMALHRAKEIGVRKVLGSSKARIVVQLLSETLLMTLVALVISLAIAELALERLQDLTGYPLEFDPIYDWPILSFAVLLFVTIGIGSGLLPAWYHARYSPMGSLRQRGRSRVESGSSVRRGLVVVQFAISQVLIIEALIVSNQTRFLQDVDMGFNRDAVVEVEVPDRDNTRLARFKSELLRQSGILGVSFSNTGTASDDDWGGDYVLRGGDQPLEGNAQIKFVDKDFLSTYQVPLAAGSNFSQDSMRGFLVNEAFARAAGLGSNPMDLLGQQLTIWTREGPILGVVQDFHTQSLHQAIKPVVIVAENIYTQAGIKVAMADLPREIASIQ